MYSQFSYSATVFNGHHDHNMYTRLNSFDISVLVFFMFNPKPMFPNNESTAIYLTK